MTIGLPVLFVILLYANAEELGLRGVILALAFVAGGLSLSLAIDHPAPFTITTALADIGLVLMLFGGDVRIRQVTPLLSLPALSAPFATPCRVTPTRCVEPFPPAAPRAPTRGSRPQDSSA